MAADRMEHSVNIAMLFPGDNVAGADARANLWPMDRVAGKGFRVMAVSEHQSLKAARRHVGQSGRMAKADSAIASLPSGRRANRT